MTLSLSPASNLFSVASGIRLAGAEIAAYDPISKQVYVTSSGGLQILSLGADLSLTLIKTVPFSTALVGGTAFGSNDVNSVAVGPDGLVAVAVAASIKTDPGRVFLLNRNGDIQNSVQVGSLPDMLTFTPDGRKILVANEAEINVGNTIDPEGSVSLIDLAAGVASAVVRTIGFTAFNSQAQALKDAGVRLFVGTEGFENRTVAQDLEPEYIAVSPDGTRAFVTLQENNAVAIIDLATEQVVSIVPLGLKDFRGLQADLTDRGGINLQPVTAPIFGTYMPDAITSFAVGGRTFYAIANEGDDRNDFLTAEETARLSSLTLDPTAFPDAATLQSSSVAGRLTVFSKTGLNGDTDGDGDIDQVLMLGGRSFSILDDQGRIVFDSGDHIERFMAQGGAFLPTSTGGSGLFDDTRSDNKGPEPEGITVGVIDGRTLLFVGIERGGGGVMVYDVTDFNGSNPASISFVQHLRNPGDVSTEGTLFISAADSPSGRPLFIASNEVSNTLTVFESSGTPAYTLQLLHFADAEAGLLASTTAPNLAALVDKFEDEFANTIKLAGGDNFIPGPFLAAGTDAPTLLPVLGVPGNRGNVEPAAVDIAIHNAIGISASALGNHEFDLGSSAFASAITPGSGSPGAAFPYITANLDFSNDNALRGRFTDTTATAGLEEASSLNGRIAPSAVVTINGERIGLVGATTQLLQSISSPSGTTVRGGTGDNMDTLAGILQPVIDDLTSQGVNKVILMAHLQRIDNEKLLATKLSGVDIILAAGSNTRLGDATDTAVGFPGHTPDFADTYPLVLEDKDGKTTLLVNTDNEFTYLGRLVVDFDSNGEVIVGALGARENVNGAYASTTANVAAAWGVSEANLATTAFAAGTRGAQVKALTDAVQSVITVKNSNVFGFSKVYLEGERGQVRSQETNLGNISADANGFAAKVAANDGNPFVVSLKNGGGIRTVIGELSAPKADGTVDKLAPAGNTVTQLGVEDSLRFNNQLITFDTTPEGLKAILEHGVALGSTAFAGRFPQVGGVVFSWDPNAEAGSRIGDIALDVNGARINLYNDGTLLPGAPASIRVVTLGFLAQGGDAYPIKANGDNFRYIIQNADGSLSLGNVLDETQNLTALAPASALGEQKAFERFLQEFHGTPETAFAQADTPVERDGRIQNLSARDEDVLTTQIFRIAAERKVAGTNADELYKIDDLSVRISEKKNGGEDTLLSTVSIDLKRFKNVENVILEGAAGLSITGSNADNTLIGNAGNNRIDGTKGANVMTGGAGRDTFVFSVRDNAVDTVTDFASGSDVLAFRGSAFGQLKTLKGQSVSNADLARFFKFNANTGVLSIDTNGDKAGGEVAVVRLIGVTALETGDVSVF